MKLYLLRHGDAVPEYIDSNRPLSRLGESEIRKIAGYLKTKGVQPADIFHSDKKRAVQSAKIVEQTIKSGAPLTPKDYLAPEDTIEHILKDIAGRSQDLMIVGHLPFLGMLASTLVLADENKKLVSFSTGTLVVLSNQADGTWKMDWSINPREIL